MWPDSDEALNHTLEVEAAVADLFAEALRRWAPDVRAAVLPELTGQIINGDPAIVAAGLPPDPDGVARSQSVWDTIAAALVLAGLSALWSVVFVKAFRALGGALTLHRREPSTPAPKIDPAVLRIVQATTDATRAEIMHYIEHIDATPELHPARDAFIDAQREAVSAVPARVRDELTTLIRDVQASNSDVTAHQLREHVTHVLEPSSQEMRDIARQEGYQAAGVMNSAVLSAAVATDDEELDKIWLSTLDGKTRPTHWAADGQRAPLAGSFVIGQSSLRYPGDPDGPPSEVRNCRCRVGVLAKDERIPDEIDRHTERLDGRDSTARNREGSQADEIARRNARGNIRARDEENGIGRVAAGGWTSPSEQERMMDTYRTFTDQVVAFIGTPTSDGRMLASDIALTFRNFPLPLMWTKQSSEGHLEAFTVGVIESARGDFVNGHILASGYLLNSPEADEASQQIGHRVTGPSVDLAAVEWMLTDENGSEISEEEWWDLPQGAKVYQTLTAAELIGTTLVSTPAFDTTFSLNAERESRDIAMVASAAEQFRPRVYDHRLFENPKLTGPTLPTMGDDGRIYGHLACFGQCHRSVQSQCVIAPRSPSNYSHFHTSPAVRLDDGTALPVGRLTVGTGHADYRLAGAPAAAHYDNTGTCFALVRVGEDEHGVWFSGIAAPWATAEQIEQGLTAPLSGDWRDFGQGLELVAALAVNTPGFAARGRDDDQGRPIALVASLGPAPETQSNDVKLSREDIKAVVLEAMNEAQRLGELAAERNALLARAREAAGDPPEPEVELTPNEQIEAMLAEAGL